MGSSCGVLARSASPYFVARRRRRSAYRVYCLASPASSRLVWLASRARTRRVRHRGAAIAFVLAAVALASGCYWSKYDKLVRTHVALLEAMADKIVEVTETDGAPASLAEYRYPLERARDFARIAGRRYAGRESLTGF